MEKSQDYREKLAQERTKLANERTVLAYVRTALSAFLVGFALIKFFEGPLPRYAGAGFLIIGCVFAVMGMYLFKKRKRILS